MVFEKFAEMNNKYDAKNFGDLIESFTVEKEMKFVDQIVESLEDGVPQLKNHDPIYSGDEP